jgi:hypothetical protein
MRNSRSVWGELGKLQYYTGAACQKLRQGEHERSSPKGTCRQGCDGGPAVETPEPQANVGIRDTQARREC